MMKLLQLFVFLVGIYLGVAAEYRAHSASQSPIDSGRITDSTDHPYKPYTMNSYGKDYYGDNFKPAETYQGDPREFRTNTESRPVHLDPIAAFINKTRSSMATGVCFTEVPTASLARDPRVIPIGNGTTPDMSEIQVCCDGYQRNAHIYAQCDPICKDDCPNGICTAPNRCVCLLGHVRNYEDKCITTCPIGCGNGVCIEGGECRCNRGFALEPLQRKYCVPNCEHGCHFGKCVAPNKCACLEGYKLSKTGTCEPQCENCGNGKCTAPNFCTCNSGYTKVGGLCEAMCSLGCNGGRCVAPDRCQCSHGYELDRTGVNCVPHCAEPCLNGVCDGERGCVCNPGYVPDDYQQNVCKPHCPQGCPNGYCTSPNFCICRPGYIKDGSRGYQMCVPV